MARKMDRENGDWKKTTTDKKSNTTKTTNKKDTSDKSTISDSGSSKDTASSQAVAEVNRITVRTLVGNLVMVPNENTISIVPRSTIELKGIGKYLSGKYYVQTVERTFDTNGYSQSAVVIKTDFKESLKVYAIYPDENSKLKEESKYKKNLAKYMKKHKKAKPKKHVVKKGETLYTISKKYFKKTKYAKVLGSINGIAKKNYNRISVGQILVIAKVK